jgi:hypothetical protein
MEFRNKLLVPDPNGPGSLRRQGRTNGYYEEDAPHPGRGCIPHRTGAMQHPVDSLPRILLLRTPVNKDEKEGRSPQRNP